MDKSNITSVLNILWGRRKFVLWMSAAVVLIGVGFWFSPVAGAGALILFTMYDLVGWEAVSPYYGSDRNLVMSYRVLQHVFLLALVALTWGLFGWMVAAAWLLVWWFGGADLLYYWIGRYPLPRTSWTWLRWTPYGIVKGNLSTPDVLSQAGVGLLVAIVGLILGRTRRK